MVLGLHAKLNDIQNMYRYAFLLIYASDVYFKTSEETLRSLSEYLSISYYAYDLCCLNITYFMFINFLLFLRTNKSSICLLLRSKTNLETIMLVLDCMAYVLFFSLRIQRLFWLIMSAFLEIARSTILTS